MALPAIADVRRAWPDASIAVAARPSVAPLFTLVARGRRGRHADRRRAVAAGRPRRRAAAAELVSFRADGEARRRARAVGVLDRLARSAAHARRAARHRPACTRSTYYQHLVRALGFPTGPAAPRLDVPPALREAGADALRQAGWDGRTPIVALAPGAAYGSSKRWPPSAFADLAAGLADEGVACVLVGAAADRGTAAEVLRAVGGRARLHRPRRADRRADARRRPRELPGARRERFRRPASGRRAGRERDGGVRPDRRAPDRARGQCRAASPSHEPPSHEPRATSHGDLTPPRVVPALLLRECPLDHECMQGIDVPRVLDETRRML